jgi:hypothetical protein
MWLNAEYEVVPSALLCSPAFSLSSRCRMSLLRYDWSRSAMNGFQVRQGGPMSGLYESLKERMHDTLQRGKAPSVRLKSSSALTLNGEMEELERIVAARLGKIRAAVKEGEAEVADEAEQANQLVESLKVRIAVLEAKLKEAEEGVRRKDLARQQTEESLRATNQELENEITKKDEALAARAREVNALKLQIDDNVKRIGELKSGMEQATEETANQLRRASALAESSQAKFAALEGQVNEMQDLTRQRDAVIEAMEQKLAAKTKEFEVVLKDKEKLVAWQQAEVADLQAQLHVLKKGIGEMSSFFRQAEVLPGITGQDVGGANLSLPTNGKEEKPARVQPAVAKVTPASADGAELVAPGLFQRISGELAEVTGVIRPLALVIVRQQVQALGETMEQFPKARLSELLEKLANEIADEKQQIDFRGRLGRSPQLSLN